MQPRFSSTKFSADKELLLLRRRLGGKPGVLSLGSERVGALQLGENVWVTTESPTPMLMAAARMAGGDVHKVKTSTDATFFAERYKAFRGALGSQA
jgi:hypothetical protein